MTTQEQIARVLELDEKRTPGEWCVVDDGHYLAINALSADGKVLDAVMLCRIPADPKLHNLLSRDMGFASVAPTMAAIIRQQQEVIELAAEVLEECLPFISAGQRCYTQSLGDKSPLEKANNAIEALQPFRKGV